MKKKNLLRKEHLGKVIRTRKHLPIKQGWTNSTLQLFTPNLFVNSSNNVLVWNALGFDLDYDASNVKHKSHETVDQNILNKHKHIFIKLVPTPSYRGVSHMIENHKSSLEATTISYVLDHKLIKFAKLSDVVAKEVHKALAKHYSADKATSAHINHPFRVENTDKPYVRIQNATTNTTLFELANKLKIDKVKLLKEFVVELLNEKAHSQCFGHLKLNKKVKRIQTRKVDAIKLCKFVIENFWKEGHRQDLAFIITGILYRYFNKDSIKTLNALKQLLPKDDEEYKKRFDPLKHIKNKEEFVGIPTLKTYLKEHFNYDLDINQFLNNTSQVVQLEYKTFEQKKHTKYDKFQAILIGLLAKLTRNDSFSYDDQTKLYTIKFETTTEMINYFNRIRNKNNRNTTAYIKLLKELEDKGIISLNIKEQKRREGTRVFTWKTIEITLTESMVETLKKSLVWVPELEFFNIYALNYILQYKEPHPKMKDRKIKDECFKILWIWSLDPNEDALMLEYVFEQLHNELLAQYSSENDLHLNINEFVMSYAYSDWNERNNWLRKHRFKSPYKPFKKSIRKSLSYILWFEQFNIVSMMVYYCNKYFNESFKWIYESLVA